MTTRGARGAAAWLLAVGVLATGFTARAEAQSSRLDKQIGIFEQVMNSMLVESPNFLIRNRDDTRGVYIDGHGAMFTFTTSLNSREWGHHWGWFGNDDTHVIVIDDEDHQILSDREFREHELDEQERLYADGKDEIVETLRDFGAVLTGLNDTDWLEIRVRLHGAAYFREHKIHKLTVKVKMSDVRAYADGSISEGRFADRVSMDES